MYLKQKYKKLQDHTVERALTSETSSDDEGKDITDSQLPSALTTNHNGISSGQEEKEEMQKSESEKKFALSLCFRITNCIKRYYY